MEANFDFGMIGLGVMGSNLLLNMADHGFAAIGFDLKQERCQALEAAANPGTTVRGVNTLKDMVLGLKKPRKMMMLVPAGKPVDDVIASLLPYLEAGDIVIDGGNSFFKDTLHRVAYLQDKGIHFFGMGISGGELGARLGPSMMPGGDQAAYQYLKPILESVAAKSGDTPCVAYMGNGAAGHYVKMVHNGIEYSMMQMISEVYDLLHRGAGLSNEQLHHLFLQWNEGQLQSFLIHITADVFKVKDTETENFLVDVILDQAGSKGTGKWTSQEALDLPVAIPSIDAAVAARNLSVYKEERVKAAKIYGRVSQDATGGSKQEVAANGKQGVTSGVKQDGAGSNKVEYTDELAAALENALAFGFVIAYAQGLSMLGRASVELKMNIPLPSVIQVWKAGCIIRSALLGNFTAAFEKEPQLSNLLLDKDIAELLQNREESIRNVVGQAIQAKIPVSALGSALSYFDNYVSERMPTNLIQAQRDYFGAHTYRRIDRDGVFHTEWNEENDG